LPRAIGVANPFAEIAAEIGEFRLGNGRRRAFAPDRRTSVSAQ